jgi:hypothetical protein
MSFVFRLDGSFSSSPTSGQPSGQPEINTPINESLYLDMQSVVSLDLTSDAAVTVPLGSLSGANVIVIKTVGCPVKVTITSTVGTSQSIQVSSFFVLMNDTNAVTSITVQRTAGIEATLSIYLGQASA